MTSRIPTAPVPPSTLGPLRRALARWLVPAPRRRRAPGPERGPLGAPASLRPQAARDLENALRDALEREAFTVAYQPIVSLGRSAAPPLGVEALARWTHPLLGALPPAVFLPLADATGLAVTLDRFVMERACAALAAGTWGRTEAPLHMNVAEPHLERRDLAAFTRQLLDHYALPGPALALELPAGSVALEPQRFAALFAELRGQGVALWIDGVGFDPLPFGRWADLGVVGVKLDPHFVHQLMADPNPAGAPLRVLAARTAAARAHGLAVVAKGVEDDSVLARLAASGVSAAQGFALAPPRSAAASGWRSATEAR